MFDGGGEQDKHKTEVVHYGDCQLGWRKGLVGMWKASGKLRCPGKQSLQAAGKLENSY